MNKIVNLLILPITTLTACSSVQVKDYQSERPLLKLDQYLKGDLQATGMFQDRFGKVVKRFHVKMKGSWSQNIGTLEEDFEYSDGSKSRRVWTLKKVADDRFIGTASDVIGEAVGEISGNALRWKYTLALQVDKSTYNVQFDDWMYLMDDRVMLNKSKMSKFGFDLGEVTLVIEKLNP